VNVPDVILAMLKAAVSPAVTYDAHVPKNDEERYAVLYIAAGAFRAEDVAHTSDLVTFRWQVTSVGTSRAQAQWVADRSRDGLIDRRPQVEGWVLGPVEHVNTQQIRSDSDAPDRVLFYGADWYELAGSR
jgi:hypothetical protein